MLELEDLVLIFVYDLERLINDYKRVNRSERVIKRTRLTQVEETLDKQGRVGGGSQACVPLAQTSDDRRGEVYVCLLIDR